MSECWGQHWGQHWGEIGPSHHPQSTIADVDRAEIITTQPVRLQCLKKDCLPNENRNTVESDTGDQDIRHVPIGNPVMLHTIQLLEFCRQLNDCDNRQILSRESIPQLDKINEIPAKQLNVFTIKDRNLSPKTVKHLLRRAVITIAVFNGYELTNKSVIDLLVDILSEYLWRLCQTIRTATDSLELMSSNDFIDVMDRVFHDMNVSDLESLRQYDSDLRLYNENLSKELNKRIGINESLVNSNKITTFQVDSNCDNLAQTSSTTQSDVKGVETSLSLKSLLSSFKTNNTEETEQLFDLTSLTNSSNNDNES